MFAQRKKNIGILIAVLLAAQLYSQADYFKAEEIAISFLPGDNYLQIIEYNYMYPLNNEADLTKNLEGLKERISECQYAKYKYNFHSFISGEEELINTGEIIKTQYDMLTSSNKPLDAFSDVLSKIFKSEVEVAVKNNEIQFLIKASKMKIADNNARAVYTNGNDFLLVWPTRLRSFEIVVQADTENYRSIQPLISQNIKSIPLTLEQVNYIRFSSPPLPDAERLFQDDADIIRLRHLKSYIELLEKYNAIAGKYPFSDEATQQKYVFIANSMQQKYLEDDNPNEHIVISLSDFFNEIDSVLGTKTFQLYDPQLVPSGRPNFYIYMVSGNRIVLAIHLSKYYPFTTKISDNYYKLRLFRVYCGKQPEMIRFLYG